MDEDVIYDGDGNDVNIDGDLLWEVLGDLPQDIPMEYDQTTRLASPAPQYTWFEKGDSGFAYINLNKALAKD